MTSGQTTESKRFPFTERRLADLPKPEARRTLYHDAKSALKFEITPADSRTFYLVQRVNGRPKRVRIGAWPELTIEAARRLAIGKSADIANGIDPVEQARAKEAESQRDGYSFEDAVNDYLNDRKAQGRVKAGTEAEYRRLVDKHLADWKPRPLARIDKPAILAKHRHVGVRNGKATANALMRVVRAVLAFATDMDRLDKNPAAVLRGKWFEDVARDTVIPAEKIPDWRAALVKLRDEKPEGMAVAADMLDLILLTGLRKGEARRIKWADVDEGAGVLSIHETKNKLPLRLPITPAMAEILARRAKARRGRSAWVFPSVGNRRSEDGPMREPRHAMAEIEAETGISVTVHDLRRTFISIAAPLVPGPVLKALVNHKAHKSGDVTQRHYVRLTPEQLRPHLQAVQAAMGAAPPPLPDGRMRVVA